MPRASWICLSTCRFVGSFGYRMWSLAVIQQGSHDIKDDYSDMIIETFTPHHHLDRSSDAIFLPRRLARAHLCVSPQ